MKNENVKMNCMTKLSIVTFIISMLIILLWPGIEEVKLGIMLWGIFSLTSIILGIVALVQIKNTEEKGKSSSITIIILGVINVILEVMSLLNVI